MEWPLAREGGVHVPFGALQSTKDSSSIIFFELVAGQRAQPLCSVIWNRTDSINPRPPPGADGRPWADRNFFRPHTWYSANPSHPSPSIGIALILRRWTPRKRMATNSTDPVAMPATMHSFLMPSVSACADAGYMQIPVLVVPLYFIPIAVFLVLLGIVVIIISEGVSTRRSPAASVTKRSAIACWSLPMMWRERRDMA